MSFIDILWMLFGTAYFFLGYLMLAGIPFMIIYVVLSYFRDNISRFEFFTKAVTWIQNNAVLFLLILALIIHSACISYEEQIDRDSQIRQAGYSEGYKEGYEKGINDICNEQ